MNDQPPQPGAWRPAIVRPCPGTDDPRDHRRRRAPRRRSASQALPGPRQTQPCHETDAGRIGYRRQHARTVRPANPATQAQPLCRQQARARRWLPTLPAAPQTLKTPGPDADPQRVACWHDPGQGPARPGPPQHDDSVNVPGLAMAQAPERFRVHRVWCAGHGL